MKKLQEHISLKNKPRDYPNTNYFSFTHDSINKLNIFLKVRLTPISTRQPD